MILHDKKWKVRKTAALSLISIEKQIPDLLVDILDNEALRWINSPHMDTLADSSACQIYDDRHSDTGIGLDV